MFNWLVQGAGASKHTVRVCTILVQIDQRIDYQLITMKITVLRAKAPNTSRRHTTQAPDGGKYKIGRIVLQTAHYLHNMITEKNKGSTLR